MNMKDRFRGAMVGAVIGDCLGKPLEFITKDQIPFKLLEQTFSNYEKSSDPGHGFKYTDDTAMARQLAFSLIHSKNHVDAKDMAKRYVDEFYKNPRRGYGRGVKSVFVKLHKAIYPQAQSHQINVKQENLGENAVDFDPFLPAKEQFNGSGSFGNGAAMRVHPTALFGVKMSPADLADTVRETALITHAHEGAIRGAILQALAVQLSLRSEPEAVIIESLKNMVQTFDESEAIQPEQTYEWSMNVLQAAFRKKSIDSAYRLGNDVSAQKSVPAAIFSYLRAHRPVEGLEEGDSFFKRTLFLAYSFGGDADTIGSMAGAIAGAKVGLSGIPDVYKRRCEGVKDAIQQADKLYDLTYSKLTFK